MAGEAVELKTQSSTAEPILVFGSDLAGRHDSESAALAFQYYGAQSSCTSGPSGQSYAVPYRDSAGALLRPQVIENYLDTLFRYAAERPRQQFQIARMACEQGAHGDAIMARLFKSAPRNCLLPGVWSAQLDPQQPARLLVVDAGAHLLDAGWQKRLQRYLDINSPLWNARGVELVSIGGNARMVVANDVAAKQLGLKHRVIGPNERAHGRSAVAIAEYKAIVYSTHFLGISDFEQTAQPQQIRILSAATRGGLVIDQFDAGHVDD